MRDFRSDLEKAIDEIGDKYAINEFSRQLIENGEQSALSVKYGLNFDTSSWRWCFRSARPEEIKESECFGESYGYTERTQSIAEFLTRLMKDVRSAVNNSHFFKNECFSYSKHLAVPLFKYYRGDPPLIIEELQLNTFDISADVHCFDWIPGDDRYHIEFFDLSVPFADMFSKKKMLERVYDELSFALQTRNGMMDVDNITMGIHGVTLDISNVSRIAFDNFFQQHDQAYFKRRASFQKDREVLKIRRTLSSEALIIKNPRALQLVRLIYLMIIGSWYTTKAAHFVESLMANHHPDILRLSDAEVKAVSWIISYLVRDEYDEIISIAQARKCSETNNKTKFITYLSRLSCFNKDFLNIFLPCMID